MSWNSFLPTSVENDLQNFAGPNLAGLAVQCLETGILINQAVRFWTKCKKDPIAVKLLVGFVSIVALFQTGLAFYNSWRVLVVNFGQLESLAAIGWPDRIQPALNCAMSAPFQAFLIWRCWNVMSRRWIILTPLAALLTATVILNIYTTVQIFVLYDISKVLTVVLEGPPRIFSTAFIVSAVLDTAITALMMWFLFSVKTRVISPRFAKSLRRINRIVWEAAIPPAVCAVCAAIFYSKLATQNLWDVFFQCILGKLYVISLFVVLNGRVDIRRESALPTVELRTSNWLTHCSPQFRLDLSTVSGISVTDSSDSAGLNCPLASSQALSHTLTTLKLDPSPKPAQTHTPSFNSSSSPLTPFTSDTSPSPSDTEAETPIRTKPSTPNLIPSPLTTSETPMHVHDVDIDALPSRQELDYGFGEREGEGDGSRLAGEMVQVKRPPSTNAVGYSQGSVDVEDVEKKEDGSIGILRRTSSCLEANCSV